VSLRLTLYTHQLCKREENTENLKSEDRGEEVGTLVWERRVMSIEICTEYLLIQENTRVYWLTGISNILREIFNVLFFLRNCDNGVSYASSIQEEERPPNGHIFHMLETVKIV
jgi:hypothetical protein